MEGHNIKNCNSEDLKEFKIFILREKKLYINDDNKFKEVLESQSLINIRGLAVNHCNESANTNNNIYINAIINKYKYYTIQMLDEEIENMIEEDSTDNEIINEDYDLLSVSSYNSSLDDNENDELEITWTIDRTGTNNLINKKTIQDFPISYIKNTTINILECNICYENQKIQNFIKLQCKHEFCNSCIDKQLFNNISCCAFCREQINYLEIYN